MNPRLRGLIYLAGGILFAWLFCVLLPFTLLPATGLAVALPVIQVPGESVWYGFWPWGGNLTNTFIGGFLAGIIVLLWVALNYRSTNGWTKRVPSKGQAWTEIFMGAFRDFCESLGGDRMNKAPLLWPLVASIFIFLLVANWMKLIPGVESVGYVHCAYAGQTGYQRMEGAVDGTWRLWVDRSLDSGTTQTEFLEEECVHHLKVSGTYYGDYEPADYDAERTEFYSRLAAVGGPVPEGFEAAETSAIPVPRTELMSNPAAEEEPDVAVEARDVEGADLVANNVCELEEVENTDAEGTTTEGDLEAEAQEDTADEAEAEATEEAEADEQARNGDIVLMSTLGVEESDEPRPEALSAAEVGTLYNDLITREEEFAAETISAGLLEEARCAATQAVYPNAVFPLSADELAAGEIQPYVFAITPFVRGAATDLSLNIGLALLSIIAVQVYGVLALGPAYFEKFVNLRALGRLREEPIGAVDFIVGIIEILSEIGKVVSLAFRLFGNLFAGGIVLMVFPFLLAFLVPGIMIGLEIIIGFVQALVFAILTLVFAVQAMEAHHGDDHDEEHH